MLCLAIPWINLTLQIIIFSVTMAVIVFSPSKASIVDPQHYVANLVLRLSREEWAGLTWVLMYIFLFLFYLCSSLISFARTGFHTSVSKLHMHYTIQGFTNNGFTYWTIHMFSIRRSVVFANSGKVWKFGAHAMDFGRECELLT